MQQDAFYDPDPNSYQNRLLRLRGWIKNFFIAGFVIEMIGAAVGWGLLYRLGDSGIELTEEVLADDGTLQIYMVVFAILGIVYFAAYVGGIIAFLKWVFRISKTSHTFAGPHMRRSRGWAVGWWFIPIANFFMPYLVLKELFSINDPAVDDPREGGQPGSLLGWYWALWLMWNFEGTVTENVSLLGVPAAVVMSLVTLAISVALLIVALRMIDTLTNWHLAKLDMPTTVVSHCPSCGYDLSGTTADTCPECGARVPHNTGALVTSEL